MPATDPVPARPQFALPDDVKNYALWLNRRVNELDKAILQFLANPQQPLSQREAVDFVVTVGHGIGWNKWLIGWRAFLASNFELIPPMLPIPVELPAFDWDAVQRYQIELEGFRSQFQSMGVAVPEQTELPGDKKPPLEGLGQLGIGLGIAATAGLIFYLTYKFA